MIELEEEDREELENLTCPKCGKGWLARDWNDDMVCQNCGAKFDMEQVLKDMRK
ncbi:MAG: hypothetical protein ACLFVL_03990 [Candidatus Aenigmatarchaeota archaeon]